MRDKGFKTSGMPEGGSQVSIRPYIQIARVDHWFKNIFILPGMVAAFLLEPSTQEWSSLLPAALAFMAACLVASSNYVLNELLDAKTDRFHPLKRDRPVPSGQVVIPLAYLEWLLLAVAGFALVSVVSLPLLLSVAGLWLMGIIYNVPPIRSKDVPYLDVLSEAINNPLRMLIGWYGVRASLFVPSSFLLGYWMIGSYLMTAKRFAEFRTINDPMKAAQYRSSFRFYTEERLANAMLAYACAFMFLMGVVMVKYHVEFILAFPLLVVYLAYYNSLTFERDSVAETPEKLYRDKVLMILTLLVGVTLWGLAYLRWPTLNVWLGLAGRGW
jgi:4-hydroxybenzoate polyprenyltransferase